MKSKTYELAALAGESTHMFERNGGIRWTVEIVPEALTKAKYKLTDLIQPCRRAINMK
jgi:hypothetical protein